MCLIKYILNKNVVLWMLIFEKLMKKMGEYLFVCCINFYGNKYIWEVGVVFRGGYLGVISACLFKRIYLC